MAKTQEQLLGERCFKQAKKRFGDGWSITSPQIRQMAVSHEVLNVLYAQFETGPGTADFVKAVGAAAFFLLGDVAI